MCEPSTSASLIRMILWYRSFSTSNSSLMPVPDSVISVWISSFLSIFSQSARSTLRIFPRLGRVRLEPLGKLLVGDLLDHRPHLGVAELGLGLTLELLVAQLHRDDLGEPLADVLA